MNSNSLRLAAGTLAMKPLAKYRAEISLVLQVVGAKRSPLSHAPTKVLPSFFFMVTARLPAVRALAR